jgi:hypothetical protein
MFDEMLLARVLDLHEKSCALLRWVEESLRNGRLSFAIVHGGTDSAAAAEEWIGHHLANIPADIRPEQADVSISRGCSFPYYSQVDLGNRRENMRPASIST